MRQTWLTWMCGLLGALVLTMAPALAHAHGGAHGSTNHRIVAPSAAHAPTAAPSSAAGASRQATVAEAAVTHATTAGSANEPCHTGAASVTSAAAADTGDDCGAACCSHACCLLHVGGTVLDLRIELPTLASAAEGPFATRSPKPALHPPNAAA